MAINQAWITLVLMAQDLLAWTQQVCLNGDLAVAEPKRLRYCLLHVAGILVHTGRKTKLRLADDWPWTDTLITAFDRLHPLRCSTRRHRHHGSRTSTPATTSPTPRDACFVAHHHPRQRPDHQDQPTLTPTGPLLKGPG